MKMTILGAVVGLALAGCGQGDLRKAGPSAGQSGTSSQQSADLWAEGAFGIYGIDAVDSCLAAFHDDYKAGQGGDYRAELAAYLCACARGTSQRACPVP